MFKLIHTIEAEDQSDLDFVRDKLDGAISDVLEENKDRFDSQVSHTWEWGEDD